MNSHVDKGVNDEFFKWLNEKYGGHGEVKAMRGKSHDYLGMAFDFSTKGKVRMDMNIYIKQMIEEFWEKYKLDGVAETPAACNLFSPGTGEMLSDEKREDFHKFVAKGLFASKRAQPDIQPTIAVLTTRVKGPTEGDWKKLMRLMEYLNGTQDIELLGFGQHKET